MIAPRTRAIEARSWREFGRWQESVPGTQVAGAEEALLDDILPNLFGFHLLQLGVCPNADLLRSSRISHRARFRVAGNDPADPCCACVTDSDALPIAAASIDVVILPHTLELAAAPHAVLREVERVLVAEGHVVVICFNPCSLWGLWRACLAWRDQVPWNLHWFALRRIRDWFALLGLDLVQVRKACYRPPLRSARLQARLQFLEKLGAYLWPYFGGVYVMVGRKRVAGAVPIRAMWSTRRRLLAAGVAEPSTRA